MIAGRQSLDIFLSNGLVVDQLRRACDGHVTIPVGDADRDPRIPAQVALLEAPNPGIHDDVVAAQFVPHRRLLRQRVWSDRGKHGEPRLGQESACRVTKCHDVVLYLSWARRPRPSGRGMNGPSPADEQWWWYPLLSSSAPVHLHAVSAVPPSIVPAGNSSNVGEQVPSQRGVCEERPLHWMKPKERCGTTHHRHSRSPRLEPWGVVTGYDD